MKNANPFPGGKSTPVTGNKPAVKPPLPTDDSTMADLREKRDRAMARKLNTQNRITREELVPRDGVKLTLGRISAAWRGTVLEHSSTTPGAA
jgi:hypothetical protein